MKEITDEKLDKYFEITEKALKMAKENITKDSVVKKKAEDFMDMAERYLSDAKHFKGKGEYVNAFGAVNYAHAWLDAGARLRFFEVHDSELFTAD